MQSTMSLQTGRWAGGWEWENFQSGHRAVFRPLPTASPAPPPVARGPGTLLTLCLAKAVSDSGLAAAARITVPRTLLLRLGEAAARARRCASLAALLEAWPQPRLSLTALSGEQDLRTVPSGDLILVDRKQDIVEGTEMVVTLLARVLKLAAAGRSPLETLDITGFPLAIGHLVHTLHGFSELGDADGRPLLTLVVDLFLTDQECWRLNRLGQLRAGGVRVVVRHIYFSVMSYTSNYSWPAEYLAMLAKLRSAWSHIFDISCASGLELSRLNLRSFFDEGASAEERNQGIQFFTSLADSFGQVTALDLSYNAINLIGSLSTNLILCDLLNHLPHLSRLDLSGNRLTNGLPVLLAQVPRLTYLNLTGCQLRTGDISYLSQLTSLSHLDLSSCSLSNKLNALMAVFTALRSALAILELVDCSLEQPHFDELLPGLQRLEGLQLLNTLGNQLVVTGLDCRVLQEADMGLQD